MHRSHLLVTLAVAPLISAFALVSTPLARRPVSLGSGAAPPILLDPNQGGTASSLSLVEMRWGRLVDVYSSEPMARGGAGVPVAKLAYRDFVIGEAVQTDGIDFRLEQDPVTARERLVILHPLGSSEFQIALGVASSSLSSVAPTDLEPTTLPPFPLVARNAAVVLRFSDLLDETTISSETVRVRVGNPPVELFPARVLPDPNFGALLPNLEFKPTRILLDFSVDAFEAMTSPTPTPVTVPGLPASTSSTERNAAVLIPTALAPGAGQFSVLRNLAGNPLSDPLTQATPSLDVVRAFRTGSTGTSPPNADPNNGFLFDATPPAIVARLAISNLSARRPAAGAAGDLIVTFDFPISTCAPGISVGHVLRAGGETATVLGFGGSAPALAPDEVYVRVDGGAREARRFAAATAGEYVHLVDADDQLALPCYVQLQPVPGAPPGAGAAPETSIVLALNEPVLPTSASSFDNVVLASDGAVDPLAQRVVAELTFDSELRRLALVPAAPLDHEDGGAESYTLQVAAGPNGLTDLAGNALAFGATQTFTLDPAAPATGSGNLSLDFGEMDETGDGAPEVRGQFTYDLADGSLRPRPVTRASRTVDRDKPLAAIMSKTPAPLISPLSPLGSRTMNVWRYADVGFEVLDEATTNVDVEGISWAPFGGSVSTDFFSEFEMRLGHSTRQPDEFPIPIHLGGGGYAMFPQSGLDNVFEQNALGGVTEVVYPRERGYLIQPGDAFVAASGTTMIPFPLNRQGVAPEDFEYFTWRDTALEGSGAPNGFGADIKALLTVGALPCDSPFPTTYEPGAVRSIGLPLLMEFRCFPDSSAIGLNGFDTSFALATQPLPRFRAHSTGGFDKNGAAVTVNPDAAATATGNAGPTPGFPTDNTFLIGQLDTVVRVSRVHSAWFEADATGAGVDFLAPVVEPRPEHQPGGTQVVFAYRGATAVYGADVADARNYDAYGDPLMVRTITGPDCSGVGYAMQDTLVVETADITVDFLGSDSTWRSSIDAIDGASWLQVRATFISNALTGETPKLDGFGVGFLD